MYKIMIVEDDASLAGAMKKQIESWGNEVFCVKDFQNVIDAFLSYNPHMVLLDIMLPFFNGYHWCGEIRKISNIPVVFLSSASENMNIIMAMNMGGDDFIPKPIDLEVMTSKIQALLRRAYDMGNQIPVLEHKGAVLNLNDAVLTFQESRIEENTLTVNVNRLRKKLEAIGLKDYIITKIGVGYIIE